MYSRSAAATRLQATIRPCCIAALTLTTLAACASVESNQAAGPAKDVYPTVSSSSQVVRPIDAYLPTAAQAVQLAHIRFRVEQTCLKESGYAVPDPEPSDYEAFVRTGQRDRVVRSDVYGYFDTANYEGNGYSRPLGAVGLVAISSPPGVPEALGRMCISQGVNAISAADPNSLPNGGPPAVSGNEPAVQDAKSSWQQCMKSHGYTAADPVELQYAHPSKTADDVAVAKSDIDCKIQTNFVGVVLGEQTKIDNEYINAHADGLAKYTAAVKAILTS